MSKHQIQVAVAIIRDKKGRILINQRQAEKDHAGWWEFPGGKVDFGETVSEALIRECREELDIVVVKHHSLIELSHEYSSKIVHLSVYVVDTYEGVPAAMEGQLLAWKTQDELSRLDKLLPADKPILTALVKNGFS
jgi:8-oxo-dGTP diphosphatase